MIKNVLITGATGDIGTQIAQNFAKSSKKGEAENKDHLRYNLYLHGTNKQRLTKLAQNLNATPIQCDFTDTSHDKIIKLFPKQIDILINNAGICRDTIITNINDNDFDDVVAVNLKAPMLLIKHISPFMIKQKWGRIVNISSLSAIKSLKGQSVYAATKAGLIGMSRVVAQELAPYNITINCIAPGLIESSMTDKIPPHRLQALLSQIPQQLLGKPQDVANTCLFLADSDTSYITGQTININF